MFKFNLGDKVKDLVSGFEGIVTIRSSYFTSGMPRYYVEPQGLTAEGKPKEGHHFDEGTLTLVEKEVIQFPQVGKLKPKFSPGDKVKDTITGEKGTVMSTAEYSTGCFRYSLHTGTVVKGDLDNITFLDEGRLVLIKQKKDMEEPKKEKKKEPYRGGYQKPITQRSY